MSENASSNTIPLIKPKWDRLLAAMRLRDEDQKVFTRLVECYSAPVRHYHNLRHIQHCLAELDSVRPICPRILTVEPAIWFHDIVYEPPRPDNEQRSAELASDILAMMGADAPRIEQIYELILDTRHVDRPITEAGRFMVDIDLSGMGQSPECFDEDGRNIRIEYAHVPDAAFGKGRIELFERLLARPQIYYTEPFHDRYETRARANLTRTIERLRSSPAAI